MSAADRPRLRSHLEVIEQGPVGSQLVVLDRLRLTDAAFRVTPLQLRFLALFDGTRSLRDIQADAMCFTGGQLVPLGFFEEQARALDEALFLDTPRFRRVVESSERPPACLGAYPEEPAALRRFLHELFTHPEGAGLPGPMGEGPPLRAVLAPHIDYARGGPCYTYAYRELFERCRASLFVIVATSHYSLHRFTLTRKHFRTPLGVIPTDRKAVDCLVAHYGDGLFDDEWLAHLPEHSVELEVVFLQYLYEQKRDVRIVPLVVGSFHDCLLGEQAPEEREDIGRMVRALRVLEREIGEPVCYIISGDLAHIGPKFGDRRPVLEPQLAHSRAQDELVLREAERASTDGLFSVVAKERDARRICGLPPAWTVLSAARPARGHVRHYDRYVHPQGHESVSFASMVFEGEAEIG